MTNTRKPRLAVDIGGTFTDVAIESGAKLTTAKTLTTPSNPVDGVLNGIDLALRSAGLKPSDFAAVIHGTTLATNALIERRGAKVGVIATAGFRDVLEIAYERRYDQYDLYLEKQDMIVSRDRVKTVRERVDAGGQVIEALDQGSLSQAVGELLDDGVESIAVCLLHSYTNPAHEKSVRRALQQHAGHLPVTLSHEVSPELREFDRLCTTVANAYIKPLMASYIGNLEVGLKDLGFDCPLFIMTSGGGMTTPKTAIDFPIRLVESGPSGGAILAARVAASSDLSQVLSFDVGGTTAKVCLIEDKSPRTSRSFEIGRADRFLKGSGIPVRIPVIEMLEIGAGGGSIAAIDRLGRLRVGPQSASSDPGPACYGRGGSLPTVTDADVVTGYLDPDAFAEGRLTLQPELAESAIARAISEPLDTTVAAGADGISQMVDEAMANAARVHAVEQGKNLADCVMVAFGGNGPLHATRVAEKVGIGQIVVPPNPSVGSAVGFLFAPISYEIVRSAYVLVKAFDFDGINRLLEELAAEAAEIVRAGAGDSPLTVTRTAFMRYAGQGHEIEVRIPSGRIDEAALKSLLSGFESEYARLFGRVVPAMDVEVMNWSVVVSTAPQPVATVDDLPGATSPEASGTRRLILGQDEETLAVPLFHRDRLVSGDLVVGPALILEPQTTTYVSAAFEARIDAAQNIVLTRRAGRAETGTVVRADRSTIDYQVMWDRLLAIVEEQAQVLMRTAFSPIVRECGDISAGIFDVEGRMLSQAVTGTPGHINTMAESVALMLARVPLAAMAPGDIYATNDPWIGAGHLNDLLLVAPIFDGERPVALTACVSHLYDLGGLGMGPDGSDVLDEGLFIPPLKLVDRGQVSQMFLEFLKANSRSPDSNEGDLYALMACCDTGARRLVEMMHEFRLTDLDELAGHILSTSKRGAEAAIADLPPGTYENVMALDGYDSGLTLKAKMTVSGTEIVTDFAGSSTASPYGINVPLNYTAAYSAFAIRCVVGPEIPNNAGSLEPFKFAAPSDSILNAQYPAPVAVRHAVGQMTSDLLLGCLHAALPGRVPAEGASCLWDLPLRSAAMARAGGNATPFAVEFTHSGGTGARPASDGLSATAFPSGVWGTQVEIAESTVPVRIRRKELIPDSGGPGRYRGGLGQVIELESSEGAPISLFGTVERTKHPARGRDGGKDGKVGRITLGCGKVLAGKGEQTIPAGERLIFETPGGGGYGDPRKRLPEQVGRDVRLGLVSRDEAQRTYGVVVSADGEVDVTATTACRRSMQA